MNLFYSTIFLSIPGESYGELNGYGTFGRKKNPIISKIIASEVPNVPRSSLHIGLPEDFRRVSAIIDIDVVPETHRRVKLMKNGTDKPLGFYIRDGTSYRATPRGVEKVAGIFISRLVPGGLAETTGLLAVNDEVLEVNGIEVTGKTLDQVTDMMVANSSNLIITVKPANQLNNVAQQRGSIGRQSQKSTLSMSSSVNSTTQSIDSDEVHDHVNDEDEDEVKDMLNEQKSRTSTPSELKGQSAAENGTTSSSPSSSSLGGGETTKTMEPVVTL